MKTALVIVVCAVAFTLFGGTNSPGTNGFVNPFQEIKQSAGIHFENHASHTSRKYLPETMVGGVAAFDYNQDGFVDLFFVNGAELKDPMPPGAAPDKSNPKYWNRLY